MRADVGRNGIERLGRVLAGRFAPAHSLFGQKRQHVGAFHERGFFGVDDGQQRRHIVTLVQRVLNVMQQLGEHGVAGMLAGVLGLEPHLAGLDVNQPLGVALEAQGLDVSVFDIFFGFGSLELGVKTHGGQRRRVDGSGGEREWSGTVRLILTPCCAQTHRPAGSPKPLAFAPGNVVGGVYLGNHTGLGLLQALRRFKNPRHQNRHIVQA